ARRRSLWSRRARSKRKPTRSPCGSANNGKSSRHRSRRESRTSPHHTNNYRDTSRTLRSGFTRGILRWVPVVISRARQASLHEIFLLRTIHRRSREPLSSRARQTIDATLVQAEPSILDELETETLVEAMSARIRGERIDQNRRHARIGETARECETHDLRAVALSQIVRIADPNIDRSGVLAYVSPIVRFFPRGIQDLYERKRATIQLRDELFSPVRRARQLRFPLPIVVRIRRAHVGLLVPSTQQIHVSERGRAKT